MFRGFWRSFLLVKWSSSSFAVNTKRFHNEVENQSKKYFPRRALMYVPGNDERKVKKIPSLHADCIILDCEDGVALNRKEEARTYIKKIINESIVEFGRSECSVRFNSVDSGLCAEDMEVILSGNSLPPTVHLPKVESKAQLDWFAEKLDSLIQNKVQSKVNLIIFIESARALLDLNELCYHCRKLSKQGASFSLESVVFGSDDFCADIGATRTLEAKELLYARQHLVTVAKAFQLQAIDLVYIDYKDLAGLHTQCIEGANMGFTGKQVIHPSQISVVHKAFSPSEEKLKWARELIDAFNTHQKSGKGAFTFRGSMIDMPLLLQAKNVIQLAEWTEQ